VLLSPEQVDALTAPGNSAAIIIATTVRTTQSRYAVCSRIAPTSVSQSIRSTP
jgi:hypothetical protein